MFTALLNKAGATDELLAKRIREGLDAMQTKVFQRRYARAVVAQVEGKEVEALSELISLDMIAFSERREMVELVLKTKGILVDKHEVDAGPSLGEILARSYERKRK